jgi:hypothetical protein
MIAAMFVHLLPSHQWIGRYELCQWTGYLASVLVLATFAMNNMRLLRITAILSNVAFISYGALQWLPPVIGLHLLLLPINLVRLIELHRAERRTAAGQVTRRCRHFHADGVTLGPLRFARRWRRAASLIGDGYVNTR